MENLKDLKDEYSELTLQELAHSVRFMKEEIKILTKKLEFMQDNNARMAIEQQSVVEGVRFIISMADKIANKTAEEKINPVVPNEIPSGEPTGKHQPYN